MDESTGKEQDKAGDLLQIPKWVRRYVQTRTVNMLVALVVGLGIGAAIFWPSILSEESYRSGNTVWFWVWKCALIPALGIMVFFSVPSWGGKLLERIGKRYYSKEGYVALGPAMTKKNKMLSGSVTVLFVICVMGSGVLGNRGYIPIEYIQPVSALYVVPFMVFRVFTPRPGMSLLKLLWPFLIGLHAVLIVSGAPIQLGSRWQPVLDMLISFVGFGIVTALTSHFYNRFALREVRRLAGTGGDPTEGVGAKP